MGQYAFLLTGYLSKSYNAITQVDKLRKENTELKQQNTELKKENFRLRNYISKTFEAVKHLFNFPIDVFKRLVDNFVQHFEK